MENDDVMLFLSVEEALTLSTILDNARTDALLLSLTSDVLNDKHAARLLNSAIDPIISQLEEELETLGVR